MPEIVGRLRPPRLAAPPSSPALGEVYYDTASSTLFYWNGTAWTSASGSTYTLPQRLGAQASQSPPSNDCDLITDSGWYYYAPGTLHSPDSAGYGYVQAFNWQGVLSNRQVAYAHGSETIWERAAPSTWKQVWPITGAALPVIPNTALPAQLYQGGQALTDFNPVITGGWYWMNSGANNAPPVGDHYTLVVYVLNSGNVVQIAYNYSDQRSFKRKQKDGVWGPWFALTDSAGNPIAQWRPVHQFVQANASGQSVSCLPGISYITVDGSSWLALNVAGYYSQDCWMDVVCHLGQVSKADAAYNYAYLTVGLYEQADQNGVQWARAIKTQHSQVQTYDHYHLARRFRLAAGTSYTLVARLEVSAGTFVYYMHRDYVWLQASTWPVASQFA